MDKKLISGVLLVLVLLGVSVVWLWQSEKDQFPLRAELTELAQCLAEKEVIFYGAYWCPHCASQKQMFSSVERHLPYIECADPADRNEQTQLCKDEKILAYPTWRFTSGQECAGPVTPEILAYLAECRVPHRGEEELTVEILYDRLILSDLKTSLKESGIAEGSEEWEERIADTRESVATRFREEHGVEVDTLEDVDLFLSILAEDLEGCAPREVPEEVEVAPEA